MVAEPDGLVAESAEFGCGACASLRCSLMLFSLGFGCVVAETCGYGSSSAMQMLQCLQDLETVAVEQLDRALLEVQSGIVLRWMRWTTLVGQVVYTRSREGAQVAWQRGGMARLEVDESPRWGRRSAAVSRLGRVVHGKRLESNRGCSEDVATSPRDGFPEERCKVGSVDDDGTGVDVGHERCGDATNANTIVNGSPEGASKGSGGSENSEFVCWCWPTSECRMMQQKDHDMGESKGFRG